MNPKISEAIVDTTHHQGTLERLDFISSLRAIAALSVAAVHLRYATLPAPTVPDWLEPYIGFGTNGVSLFFIISGFTLCLSMDSRRKEPTPLASFYLRRFFRIAPLFYAWIAISIARDYWMHGTHYSIGKILLSLTFTFNIVPGEYMGIALASWTIGLEMLFYMVFPLIYENTKTIKSSVAGLAATLIIAGIWNLAILHFMGETQDSRVYAHFGVLNYLPVFALGIVAYRVFSKFRHAAPIYGAYAIAASVTGLAGCAYFRTLYGPTLYPPALCCALLVVGLGILPLKSIVNSTTVFLGEISYSIYLSHTTACFMISMAIAPIYSVFPQLPSFILAYLLLIAVTIPISYATYQLIERPGNALGKVIIRGLRRSQKIPDTALG